MTSGTYKIIFTLLSFCILSILALEGFWIRSFYVHKTEEFDRTVNSAIKQLEEKLQERENLNTIKMTYFIQNGDTIVRTPSRNLRIITEANDKVVVNGNSRNVITTRQESLRGIRRSRTHRDSVIIQQKGRNVNLLLGGTSVKIILPKKKTNDSGKQVLKINKAAEKINKAADEISLMVNKMKTEIKIVDTEDNNPDTLKSLIRRTLENKGLFTPYEFSIKKSDPDKKEDIVQSKGFHPSVTYYKNLAHSTTGTGPDRFVFLQFPAQNSIVLAGMKSSIILSFIFSLFIIGVFYYTMKLILNQKKLNDIRTDFVNNITNELKAPIITMSETLVRISTPLVREDREKLKTEATTLKSENHKLNSLVERVLRVALLNNVGLTGNETKEVL